MERWLHIMVAMLSLMKMLLELPVTWSKWQKRWQKKKEKRE